MGDANSIAHFDWNEHAPIYHTYICTIAWNAGYMKANIFATDEVVRVVAVYFSFVSSVERILYRSSYTFKSHALSSHHCRFFFLPLRWNSRYSIHVACGWYLKLCADFVVKTTINGWDFIIIKLKKKKKPQQINKQNVEKKHRTIMVRFFIIYCSASFC